MSVPSRRIQQRPQVFGEQLPECEGCLGSSLGLDVSYCSTCGLSLCDTCWDAQLVHRPRLARSGGKPHVKTDPWIAQHINNIFSQPQDAPSLEALHSQDEKSAWFGIERFNDPDRPLLFQDHGRYADLMVKSQSLYRPGSSNSSNSGNVSDNAEKSPSLVSFVGQTGAGKSTIIKLLVELGSKRPTHPHASPVIGMIGKNVPTSKDVHLYSDPSSSQSQAPLLYADCEGLDGGERDPLAARFRIERSQRNEYGAVTSSHGRYYVEHEVQWAKSHAHRTRHFAVSSFYPRILFTFSDVVVFVHRNSRVIEPVLERLIEWAETALETSSNQPILPCAILAINASEETPESEAWDVDVATRALLDSLDVTVNQNVIFSKYAKIWRGRGRAISTMEDLFLCYFSSFRVVQIPTNVQQGLMHDQTKKLYAEISKGSQAIRERKASLRMLLNVYELHSYLRTAFEHFSGTIDIPFDFVQAAFANRRIPVTFGGNILELAVGMMKRQPRPSARAIFDKLSFFVASCIMLDAIRNKIKGTAEHIFPHYIEHLDTALQEFCMNHWPCEYVAFDVVAPGLELRRSDMWFQESTLHHCVNVQSGHGSKGHQTEAGYIFDHGPYQTKFSFEKYRDDFHVAVYSRFRRLIERLAELESYGESQESAALLMHREDILRFFFGGTKGEEETSLLKLRACLCCLFNTPEHALPCGHVLCTACVRGYGTAKGRDTIQVSDCPLHGASTKPHQPRLIHLKPDSVGVRVLTLDDCGIRSFLQLKILRLIENEFNGKISIQHLFDLVVGKGASSIIALHLASDRWAPGSCSIHLEKIFRGSFDRSQVRLMPAMSRRHGFFSKHRYHSKGLQSALKTVFTEKRTLFDTPDGQGFALKAAIVTGTGGKPMVFTNYRNSLLPTLPYDVYWPDEPANELKAWEVIRASMSNPSYFKPYRHIESNQIFCEATGHRNLFLIAGGEHKRLYPNQPSNYPDIFLSLGGGCGLTSSSSGMKSPTQSKPNNNKGEQGQESWNDFLFSLPSSAPLDKFVRIDPAVDMLPELDDLDNLEAFQGMIKSYLDVEEIKTLALRLFANLFYFELAENHDKTADGVDFEGTILCRLPNDTVVVRDVGKLLQTNRFANAVFVMEWGGLEIYQFPISSATIEGMIKVCQFHLPTAQLRLPEGSDAADIKLWLPNGEAYSISGFPRVLKSKTGKKLEPINTSLSPRPSWDPPTLERLALVDLGPLKSPVTSNASYRSLSGRSSSNSTSNTNYDREAMHVPELDATQETYEVEASQVSGARSWEQEIPVKSRVPDKLMILQAVRESDIQQRVAEREALRRLARKEATDTTQPYGTARARTPPRVIRPLPRRRSGRGGRADGETRVSESSDDEIFGKIITSPTRRNIRGQNDQGTVSENEVRKT